MKTSILAFAVIASIGLAPHVLAQAAPAAPAAAPPDALKDPQAQVSYAIGLNLGASLRRNAVTVDPQIVAQGVKDALSGATPKMSEDQVRAVLAQVQAGMQARRQESITQAAASNKAQGAAFLEANRAKPGVVTLASGLQYEILTAGTGPKPRLDDVVICNYRGTLLNGTEFDSSYARGTPSSFPVGGVIKGWTEALQKMPVGSKWRLYVPADLAYGEKSVGDLIGPNSVLIFEVELISIQKGK